MGPNAVGALVRSLLLASVLAVSPADAARTNPVAIGEIRSKVAANEIAAEGELLSAVRHELARMDFSKVKRHDRYVLSATLIKLDSASSGSSSEATCVVSATLRREQGGALHAVLSGRARATDASRQRVEAQRAALRAAVRSALSRVPEALR